MKREIIFKGIREDIGEWVEGDLLNCNNGDKRILKDPSGIPETDKDVLNWVVIIETVCQFTGLKDKNGVKIFEGDKVTATWFYKTRMGGNFMVLSGVVEFNKGCFSLVDSKGNRTALYMLSDITVNGNIHDK